MADILPGTIWRESEFQGGLTGACGPNALGMAYEWSHQIDLATVKGFSSATAWMFSVMRSRNLCDPNGPSTINGLQDAAVACQLPVTGFLPYQEPRDTTEALAWISAQLAAGSAVVMETANGQALKDVISGQGENARGLKYHFILVVGHGARAGVSGFWVCDGDNFAQGNVLQFYPDDVLAAAQPCAALAIGPVAAAAKQPTQQEGHAVMALTPNGDGTFIDTSTGERVGAGFNAYYTAQGLDGKVVLGEYHSDGQGSYVRTGGGLPVMAVEGTSAHASLVAAWKDHAAVSVLAADIAADFAHQIEAANKRATDLAQQVAALNGQLEAAKATPPAPVAAPDAATQHAVALVAAIKAAVA